MQALLRALLPSALTESRGKATGTFWAPAGSEKTMDIELTSHGLPGPPVPCAGELRMLSTLLEEASGFIQGKFEEQQGEMSTLLDLILVKPSTHFFLLTYPLSAQLTVPGSIMSRFEKKSGGVLTRSSNNAWSLPFISRIMSQMGKSL